MPHSVTARLAYSTGELAELLGVTRQHIRNLVARGDLYSVLAGRRRLIPATAVDQLLAFDEVDFHLRRLEQLDLTPDHIDRLQGIARRYEAVRA